MLKEFGYGTYSEGYNIQEHSKYRGNDIIKITKVNVIENINLDDVLIDIKKLEIINEKNKKEERKLELLKELESLK
jgi:hypothetical protein